MILPPAFDAGNGVKFRVTSAHDDALSGLSIGLCLPLAGDGDRFLRDP